ncbi:MAG: PDZ domain-containing protein [Gammaproteobacteria bacterium]|nr:PDZ domain-containing protein [Gammaproteobacteria bacterium]
MSNTWMPPTPLTPQQVQDSVAFFEDSSSMQGHVATLASPILVMNAELCKERTVYSLGLEWLTINDLPIEVRKDVGPAVNVGEIPSILYVEKGSAADRAGLRRNDLLLAVNDVSIKEDPLQTRLQSHVMGVRPYRRYLTEILALANEEGNPVRLTYRRGGVDIVATLQPQKRCNVRVIVTEDAGKFLASDGGTIYLSRGLCDFTQSDAELQALVAHQLGHFIGGHGTKDASGSIAGGVVGGVATAAVVLPVAIIGTIFSGIAGESEAAEGLMEGSVALIKGGAAAGSKIGSWVATAGHEMEADYVSTYLLARAGVDLDEALLVWDRLPSESDAAQKHHASDARLENIEKAIEEVRTKRDSNEPLIPNPNREISESNE